MLKSVVNLRKTQKRIIPCFERNVKKMRHLSHKEFHWDGDNDLIFQGRAVCSLIQHEKIPNHYHLKFEWRDEKTPEFFNIINARENARLICRKHCEESLAEGSLVSLNGKDES